MKKKRDSRRELTNYIRECRKPGSGVPGYVFVLSRFAACVGVSRQQLRLWLTGDATPSIDHRKELHTMTGGRVDPDGWGD